MEKKVNVFKQGLRLTLLIILLTSCSGGVAQREKSRSTQSQSVTTSSKTSVEESDQSTLRDFKSSVIDLRNELEGIDAGTKTEADVGKVIVSYKQLNRTNTLFEDQDHAVFEALETMGKIEKDEKSPTVGALQQALVNVNFLELKPEDPPAYGQKTNESLIAYLKEIEKKVSDLKPTADATASSDSSTPSPANPEQTKASPALSQKDRTMPFEIIPTLFGLFLLGTLGALAFWIWKLGQRISQIHDAQVKLASDVRANSQSLQRKADREFSLREEVSQLTQRLELQEQTIDVVAQSSHRGDTLPIQRPEEYRMSHRGQPRADAVSPQRPQTHVQPMPSPPPNADSPYLRLVNQYNQSPNSLATRATGVSQTQESLKQNLQDSSQTNVILARDNSPNYWIMHDESENLWLFPKEGWEGSMGTLESFVKIFTFTGDPQSKKYRVVKPALVMPTGQNSWRLKETGEIEFN